MNSRDKVGTSSQRLTDEQLLTMWDLWVKGKYDNVAPRSELIDEALARGRDLEYQKGVNKSLAEGAQLAAERLGALVRERDAVRALLQEFIAVCDLDGMVGEVQESVALVVEAARRELGNE